MRNLEETRQWTKTKLAVWVSTVTICFAVGIFLPDALSHFRTAPNTSANVQMPSCSENDFLALVVRWYEPYSVDQTPYLRDTHAYCRNGWGLLRNFEANSAPGTATALFKVQNEKWSLVTIFPAEYAGDYYCPGLPPSAVQAIGSALACDETLPSTPM